MRSLLIGLSILTCLLLSLRIDSPLFANSESRKDFAMLLMDKPGSKTFLISEVLPELFPDLRNPRRMGLSDLGESEEQEEFLEGGYAFVLRGDFNRDGKADIAFVGKHQVGDREDVFFAILSINGHSVTREFYRDQFCDKQASLMLDSGLMPGTNSIVVHCTISGDYCAYVAWNGQEYTVETCP